MINIYSKSRKDYIIVKSGMPFFSFWVVGSTSFDPYLFIPSEIAKFDFGDGTSETTTNSPTHVYADTNNYLVKISLSDLALITELKIQIDGVYGEILNLDKLINLSNFECYSNNISIIDITKNPLLTLINCSTNNINVLDTTFSINLVRLYCKYNNISILNLTNTVNLKTLDCRSNNILDINFTNLTILESVFCNGNEIKIFDFQSPNLSTVYFPDNNLTSAENDTVFINLNDITTKLNGTARSGGTNAAPTSTSQAARDNLTASGWTLIL